MDRLRGLIDTNCPMIFPGNWEAEHERGWRHAKNLVTTDEGAAVKTIQDYQTAHGLLNVTIGNPFSAESMMPATIPQHFGLYVRDIEDLVQDFNKGFDYWLRDVLKQTS